MEVKMGSLLSNPVVMLTLLLVLLLLIALWLATRNRVPVVNCDTVLLPEACDPNWLNGVQYVPLSQLPASDCDDRILDRGVGKCTMFTYTNKGQNFTLTVESGDQAVVQDYINNAAVYFTVHKVGVRPRTPIRTPSLMAILLETITSVTRLDEKGLMAVGAQLEDDRELVTLADIVSSVVKDQTTIKQILETAIARATEEYERAGVDAGTVAKTMTALFNEPGATFVLDPNTLLHDRKSERDYLSNNPLSLMVTLDWATAPKNGSNDSWVVWFSVDPTIRDDKPHTYKSPRKLSGASASIESLGGRIVCTLARSETGGGLRARAQHKTADDRNVRKPESMLDDVSPDKCNFRVSVSPARRGDKYILVYAWTQ